MKNPFRRSPLTEDNLKRMREIGLAPYTRVLIPLGRKRCIVLIGSTDIPKPKPFDSWMEEVEAKESDPVSDPPSTMSDGWHNLDQPSVACMQPVRDHPNFETLMTPEMAERLVNPLVLAKLGIPDLVDEPLRWECLDCGNTTTEAQARAADEYFKAKGWKVEDWPAVEPSCPKCKSTNVTEHPSTHRDTTHDGLDRRYTCANCDRPRSEHGPTTQGLCVGLAAKHYWCPGQPTYWEAKPRG